ncbi:MAG: UDP-3-O-(3-hydroxymyristoyl)glucosamine N-acyltransferase [Candidatus Cloacimonadaceae bacterium]
MKIFKQALTPQAVNRIIGGELIAKKEVSLNRIADPTSTDEQSVIFLDSEKFLPLALACKAGLIIAGNKFKEDFQEHQSNLIFTENSYQSVLILMHFWLEAEKSDFVTEVHPTAVIGKGVKLPEHIKIGAYAVIDDVVEVGDYTQIDSFCSIGRKSKIGSHCHLFPNVSIYEDTVIGDKVYIHSGCVIGADGFGYLLLNNIQQKIPQIGQVIIYDNVEIGANTTIDRGTISPTVIGEGTKIDNMVQIGHNCVIGKHCILCAQVGLAGSSVLGDYVYLAGQVGLAGHLTLGDRVMVGAQSGVASDLEAGKKFFGYPARDAMLMKKIMAVESHLPDMYKFIQKLKKDKGQE